MGMLYAAQFVGIHRDLVLLDEAADGRHFGHPGNAGQAILQIPVLDRAELAESWRSDLREYMNAQPTPVASGPRVGRHAFRQPPRDIVEVFEDAAARPVHVGAIFENDVDKREAEEGIAAHDLGIRDGQHRVVSGYVT